MPTWTVPSDFKEFVESLNANEVEFLIVGAHAQAHYEKPRYTPDIDFWVRPEAENAKRILKAIEEFGFTSIGVTAEDLTEPDQEVQLGFPPNRVDLVTSITGVEFEQAWKKRTAALLDGLAVNYLSKADLIENKQASGRKKEIPDSGSLAED